MSKNDYNSTPLSTKLVPKLRFPEFMKSDEWDEKSIVSIGEVITGNTPSKEDEHNWGGDFVWITAQDFKNKYITTSTLKLTKQGKDKSRVIPENSVLVTCIASIGLNGINKVQCATNQQINAVVCNAENYFEFIYYAITYNNNRLKNLAGQTAVPIINKSVFENFTVAIPKDQNEQQKIADCLSSLDDLITAENQILETLKAHKKGLMQNLFPAEGEAVPKLRFKEFENSGEWVEDVLGGQDIGVFINEKISTDEIQLESYVSTENLLPDYGGKTIASKLPSTGSVTRFKQEDILLSNIRPYLKKVWFANIDGGASNDVIVIRAGSNIEPTFLSFILKNDDFINYIMKGAEGVKMPRGDKELIKEYPVSFPKKTEQLKIASCLSSLDEQIVMQNQKIEAYRLHKKGLMQNLFPNFNGAN